MKEREEEAQTQTQTQTQTQIKVLILSHPLSAHANELEGLRYIYVQEYFLVLMANAFLSLVRLTDFNGFFLDYITIVAGVVVSGKDFTTKVDMTLLLVMLFSLSAVMFAFVVNDLSDASRHAERQNEESTG